MIFHELFMFLRRLDLVFCPVTTDEVSTALRNFLFFFTPTASPVSPFHSWSFIFKTHGKLVGTPPLNLFGTSLIQDKGMIFDGVGTFATADLPRSDCLRDPGLCVNGFSIGCRIKFDQADMAYAMPKYIFDSGARSLSTRGVSVYIVKGSLFFELATATRAWKVC